MVPLAVRCITGALAFIAAIKVISMVPLTIFEVITKLTPFVIGLIAYVWLGERLGTFQIVAMCLCFVGIAIVALSANDDDEQA